MADAAEHQRAGMQADADPQRSGELSRQLAVQPLQGGVDLGGGEKRGAAGGLDRLIETEQGHHAVAHIFVDPAAGGGDRFAGLGEEAVEQEHRIVGEPRLAEGGEAADVEEEDGERPLHAGLLGIGREDGALFVGRADQPRDAQVSARPRLAGEADAGLGVDACQCRRLGRARRRQVLAARLSP